MEGFCPGASLPCRADLRVFFPGDYVQVSSARNRLAAAYVLPRNGDPDQGSDVWVSVVQESPGGP